MKKIEIRRYQQRAIENFQKWIDSGEKLATITIPTGTGKTYSAAMCLNARPDLKVLWAAHRKELIDQAHDALKRVMPDRSISIERAKDKADSNSEIVVGSVQTLALERKHLEDFVPNVIVIDEYHHYSENNVQYDGLLKRWPDARIVGLTATPYRFGSGTLPLGRNLIHMDIGTAVEKGYLVPPVAESLITNISLADVRTKMGDFAVADLSKAVNVESRNRLICNRVIELVQSGRQGILFAVDVPHAKALHEMLKNSVRAAEVYGDTSDDERNRLMSATRKGEIDVVINNLVCLDSETEILSSEGWVNIDSITKDHKIANWDAGRIFFEKSKEIVIRPRKPNERMVVLNTRRRSIRITEDHELLFSTDGDSYHKYKAKHLVNKTGFLPVSGLAEAFPHSPENEDVKYDNSKVLQRIRANSYALRKQGFSLEESKKEAQKRIYVRDGLKNKYSHELSEEECQFIGFWIGDGTRTNLKSGGVEYKLTQSISNKNIIDWFDCLVNKLSFDCLRKEKPKSSGKITNQTFVTWSFPRGTGFGPQKRNGLFSIEKFLDKNGNDLFWGLNEKQFDALLFGLWKADGNHLDGVPRNCFVIHQKNKKLLDLLQAISVCRNYRASIRTYFTKNNPDGLSYLSFTKTKKHQLTKYTLQFENGWTDEKVWCVRTSSGNIITRRKGSVTIMGNCTEGFDVPHLSFVVVARPTRSLGLFIQMVGRGLRAAPNKKDCIVIDVNDKLKIKQSRITFSDMASHGDLYGDRKRALNVIKADVPTEPITHVLKNFPVFLNKDKDDRWRADEESFSISSWQLTDDQWVMTWTAEKTVPKMITRRVYKPWKKFDIDGNGIINRPVKHPRFGDGYVKKVLDGKTGKVVVEFGWENNCILMHDCMEIQTFVNEYSAKEIDTLKTERLFYICMPDAEEKGRVISFTKKNNDLVLDHDSDGKPVDLRMERTLADSWLLQEAQKDDVLHLVRCGAKWKGSPATDKQKQFVEKMVTSSKITFNIDLDTLSKGEASSVIEQTKWEPLIRAKFGTNYKEKLLGYDKSEEDV